jgi:hypothetical protein
MTTHRRPGTAQPVSGAACLRPLSGPFSGRSPGCCPWHSDYPWHSGNPSPAGSLDEKESVSRDWTVALPCPVRRAGSTLRPPRAGSSSDHAMIQAAGSWADVRLLSTTWLVGMPIHRSRGEGNVKPTAPDPGSGNRGISAAARPGRIFFVPFVHETKRFTRHRSRGRRTPGGGGSLPPIWPPQRLVPQSGSGLGGALCLAGAVGGDVGPVRT